MPDLFDNFFTKISTTLNGGKTPHHYSNASLVNTGKFYNYHENGTNNKYWMPTVNSDFAKSASNIDESQKVSPRMGSVSSTNSELEDGKRSRMNSVASEFDK